MLLLLILAVISFSLTSASIPPLPISLYYFVEKLVQSPFRTHWQDYIATTPIATNALASYSLDEFSIDWHHSKVTLVDKYFRIDLRGVNLVAHISNIHEIVITDGHVSFNIHPDYVTRRFSVNNLELHADKEKENRRYNYLRYSSGFGERSTFAPDRVQQLFQQVLNRATPFLNQFIRSSFTSSNPSLLFLSSSMFRLLQDLSFLVDTFHVSMHQPYTIPLHLLSSILFEYLPLVYRNISLMKAPVLLNGFQLTNLVKIAIDRTRTSITAIPNGAYVQLKNVNVWLEGRYFWTNFGMHVTNVDVEGKLVLDRDNDMNVMRPRIEDLTIRMTRVLPNVYVSFENRYKIVGDAGWLFYSALLSKFAKVVNSASIARWLEAKVNEIIDFPLTFNFAFSYPVPIMQLNLMASTSVDVAKKNLLLDTSMSLPSSQEIFYENMQIPDTSLVQSLYGEYVIAKGQYKELVRHNANLTETTLNYFLKILPIVVSKILNNLEPMDLAVPDVMPGFDAHIRQLRFENVSISPNYAKVSIRNGYIDVSLKNIHLNVYLNILLSAQEPTFPLDEEASWYMWPLRKLKRVFRRGVYHFHRLFSKKRGHKVRTHAQLDISLRLKSHKAMAPSLSDLCERFFFVRDLEACPINENSLGVFRVNSDDVGRVSFQSVSADSLSIDVHSIEAKAFGVPAGQVITQALRLNDVNVMIADQIERRIARTLLGGQKLIPLPSVNASQRMLVQLADIISPQHNHVLVPIKLSIPSELKP